MPDWLARLTQQLEPALAANDPRPAISAYHDMPYAIFRYPPEAEFELRRQVSLLRTRLETNHGKRVVPVQLKVEKKLKSLEVSPKRLMWSETLEERTPALERRGQDEVTAPTFD